MRDGWPLNVPGLVRGFAGRVRGLSPWADIWVRSGWRVQQHCTGGHAILLDPSRGVQGRGTADDCVALAELRAPRTGQRRGVILLHGILNGTAIMGPVRAALAGRGWAVADVGYPSTRCGLLEHAAAASRVAAALAEDGAAEISFVAHSMGGHVARAAMARADCDGWKPGRFVAVGHPATGSEMADRLGRFPGFAAVLGPSGQVLTSIGAASVPLPQCRGVAVIAGGTGGRGYNPWLDGDNDFTVAVRETRMQDVESAFLLVRAMHNPLMRHPRTIESAVSFLEKGRIPAGC